MCWGCFADLTFKEFLCFQIVTSSRLSPSAGRFADGILPAVDSVFDQSADQSGFRASTLGSFPVPYYLRKHLSIKPNFIGEVCGQKFSICTCRRKHFPLNTRFLLVASRPEASQGLRFRCLGCLWPERSFSLLLCLFIQYFLLSIAKIHLNVPLISSILTVYP